MDELITTSRGAAAVHRDPPGDEESRFRNLVQSPMRAGLLRFLSARPEEAFDIDSLMSTFGRMRLDVETCLRELIKFGVVRCSPGPLLATADSRMYCDKRVGKTDAARRLVVAADADAVDDTKSGPA